MVKQTVGVIGLGLMGEVLATRLMAAGFGVRGTDIDPAKNARLTSRGGEAVVSAAGVASCGVIAFAVFSTDQVEAVVGLAKFGEPGPAGLFRGSFELLLGCDVQERQPSWLTAGRPRIGDEA